MLALPVHTTWLGYCFETENQEHTHLIMQTEELISKMELIQILTPYLEVPCEIEVKSHPNIQTIVGYHCGLGDKPRCGDTLVMLQPDGFDPDDWIRRRIMHAPRNINGHKMRNKFLLETENRTLVDEGFIRLENLSNVIKNKEAYSNEQEDDREELPIVLRNPWGPDWPIDTDNKKCHYWVWSSRPNRGKTTFGQELVHSYRGVLKTGGWEYWSIRKDNVMVVLDEFNGGLRYDQLNSLCDGSFDFKVIYKGMIKLDNKPLVIVFSNKSIREVFPNMYELVESRFNEVNVD